jgi:hypothetical protein
MVGPALHGRYVSNSDRLKTSERLQGHSRVPAAGSASAAEAATSSVSPQLRPPAPAGHGVHEVATCGLAPGRPGH